MSKDQKETNIQRYQNILTHIQGTVIGLESIYNYFDGEFDIDGDISFTSIADGETQDFEHEAKGIKNYYLVQAIKDQHNRYVALLAEWQYRTGTKLNELLLDKPQKQPSNQVSNNG